MLMVGRFGTLALTVCAALGLPMGFTDAQQTGGILKFFHRDSPASMSIHEEATISTVAPMMGIFKVWGPADRERCTGSQSWSTACPTAGGSRMPGSANSS